MKRKIIGITVGTPTSPSRMERELKPVKSVNGVTPDSDGNVDAVLIVHMSTDESGTFVSSSRVSDIKAHLENGGFVVGRTNGRDLPLYEIGENYVSFLANNPEGTTNTTYEIYEDGTIRRTDYMHIFKFVDDVVANSVADSMSQAKENGEFDGKTAYEYAKDAGYTGTEEDFSKKLAGDFSGGFTVTDDGQGNVVIG
jgi:hypothetical protein